MKKYDLRINSRGKVDAMERGFFENVNKISLAPMPECIEIGNYRITASDYQWNKALFAAGHETINSDTERINHEHRN